MHGVCIELALFHGVPGGHCQYGLLVYSVEEENGSISLENTGGNRTELSSRSRPSGIMINKCNNFKNKLDHYGGEEEKKITLNSEGKLTEKKKKQLTIKREVENDTTKSTDFTGKPKKYINKAKRETEGEKTKPVEENKK
ncbi:hypothetical protein V6N12_052876 [Hibiscus sabdariffa]|uniref:Uncharacterized protein n=1 Tax=Hibiscus sabdariffa TaxID=183260 RepID=A0ABR2C2V8_9ROSI